MLDYLIEFPLAFAGTVSFSILFGVPKRHYLPCGLNGGLAWIIYRLVSSQTFGTWAATFLAAVVLSTMSRFLAVRFRAPTVIFLYGGIFTLVPGGGIYAIAYNLFLGSAPVNLMPASDTLMTAVAITLGIGISSMIPAKWLGWKERSLVIKNRGPWN